MEVPALSALNVYKTYNSGGSSSEVKNALTDLNLIVPKGSIFGLLGPNGAGKSTLINIIAGSVVKTSGTIAIMGHDIELETRTAKMKIGIVPQEIVIDSFFPLAEALELYAGYYGLRPKQRRTDEILKSLSLYDKRNLKPSRLSGGMKRRYLIAKALVHDPDLLILDEPTAGVDIELRNQLWELIKTFNKQGKTIILTTHYLAEAQELCSHIAFINHGKIIKIDEKEKLLSQLSDRFLTAEFEEDISDALLSSLNLDSVLKLNSNTLTFDLAKCENNFSDILIILQKTNLKIKNLKISEPDLEDVFLKIINS